MMGLEDRIEDEMVVDTESFFEEYFDQASELFRIFENGSIDIKNEFEDAPWRERVLIHLIGQRYAYEGGKVDKPTLPYDYFYSRVEVDDSTVRACMNELDDDLIVEKDEESNEWMLIPDNLPTALSRIEGLEE
jgi:hypothetical protein